MPLDLTLMPLINSPTFWVVLGCFMIGSEIFAPGFILMFFGLSALTVAGLVYVIPANDSLWPVWVFAALSVAYLVLLRRYLKRVFRGREKTAQEAFDNFTGQSATVTHAIAPGAVGKVEFHGTKWDAMSDVECPEGARVTVVRKESLMLFVKPHS